MFGGSLPDAGLQGVLCFLPKDEMYACDVMRCFLLLHFYFFFFIVLCRCGFLLTLNAIVVIPQAPHSLSNISSLYPKYSVSDGCNRISQSRSPFYFHVSSHVRSNVNT